MGSAAIIVLPIVIAAHSAWQQHKSCIGPRYTKPITENFCAGLRQVLNESCSAMLSIPLVEPVRLNIGETITPIKFDAFTKETIRQTYGACTDFWDGDGTNPSFSAYQSRLNAQASVLNLLFAKLPPISAPAIKATRDALAGQGASGQLSPAEIKNAFNAMCEGTGNCGNEEPSPPGFPAFPLSQLSIEIQRRIDAESSRLAKEFRHDLTAHEAKSESMLMERISSLSAKLDDMARRASPPPLVARRLVAEATFSTGDASLSDVDCSALASAVKRHLSPSTAVAVTAYADVRGHISGNLVLSRGRAGSVASCLVRQLALPAHRITADGAGILWTIPADMKLARKAAVYLHEAGVEQPNLPEPRVSAPAQ